MQRVGYNCDLEGSLNKFVLNLSSSIPLMRGSAVLDTWRHAELSSGEMLNPQRQRVVSASDVWCVGLGQSDKSCKLAEAPVRHLKRLNIIARPFSNSQSMLQNLQHLQGNILHILPNHKLCVYHGVNSQVTAVTLCDQNENIKLIGV